MHFDTSIKPDFLRLTHNNDKAWDFVQLFAERSHDIDDMIDLGKVESDEKLIEAELKWMLELSSNPFYQAHSSFLMPIIIVSCSAWLDANRWEQSEDEVKRVHSDVLKSHYHEVIFAVVYLCGGWNAMREFSKLHRQYQQDNYHGNV